MIILYMLALGPKHTYVGLTKDLRHCWLRHTEGIRGSYKYVNIIRSRENLQPNDISVLWTVSGFTSLAEAQKFEFVLLRRLKKNRTARTAAEGFAKKVSSTVENIVEASISSILITIITDLVSEGSTGIDGSS